jgi:hypothetical protein
MKIINRTLQKTTFRPLFDRVIDYIFSIENSIILIFGFLNIRSTFAQSSLNLYSTPLLTFQKERPPPIS